MSSTLMVGVIAFAAFLVLVFLGLPVNASMMICGTFFSIGLMRTPKAAFAFLSDSFLQTFSGYTTAVCPMFILMGNIAAEAQLGDDLFDAFRALIGHRRGGLASATQVACAVFGAICGSSAATVALMGRVAYPQMKRYKYKDTISCGGIASGSSLAILIPPSLALISYGIAAEASIGKLLLGGILTGIVLMVLFIITIQIWCAVDPEAGPASRKFNGKEKWRAIRNGGLIEIFLVFALSMGGMFAGWFTPTEAGAVGSAGMIIVTLIFKRFSLKVLWHSIRDTITMSGMLYVLMTGSSTFGKLFTVSGIPAAIGSLVTTSQMSSFMIILLITIIYLVLGCFVDAIPLVLLMTPIFLPTVRIAGFNEIWFGCYVVVIVGMGGVTPPVGMSCYILGGMLKDVPLMTIFKGSVPYVIAYFVMAIVLALVPGIATWLPNLIMG